MTADEALRFLRVSSRCHVANIEPPMCAALADAFENAVSDAKAGPNFDERSVTALRRAESAIRRTMDHLEALNDAFDSQVTAAVLVEREACAQLVEGRCVDVCESRWLADGIRARSHHDTAHNGGVIDYGVTSATK